MRKDREKATELRRGGKSYKEINRILNIPTATLCGWFKDLDWSIEIRNRLGTKASFSYPEKLSLMVAATRKKFALLHEEYRQKAIEEFKTKKNDPIFIAGVMLYWGEGDKKLENGQVCLSNSDPEMIKIFYLFLARTTGVPLEKIGARLILYPDLIESVQKNIWSKVTKIPISKFTRSTYIQGRHPTKRNSYGVCLVRVCSRELKEKILVWINLYQKELA
jgi:hypothetical protein